MSTNAIVAAARYDLNDGDDLARMGTDMARDWTDQLAPLIRALTPVQRAWFFTGLIGPVVGHVIASTDPATVDNIVATIQEIAASHQARKATKQ